jgi:hypothetical protein
MIYRTAIEALARRAERYALNVGIAEDDLFSALTGGKAGETFSERMAEDERAGDETACFVCWCLSWMVQHYHCPLTLAGQNIPPLAAIRAFFWITLVLSLPVLAWFYPIPTIGGTIAVLATAFAIWR